MKKITFLRTLTYLAVRSYSFSYDKSLFASLLVTNFTTRRMQKTALLGSHAMGLITIRKKSYLRHSYVS